MIKNNDFRENILRPALHAINKYSFEAEELLVATMAHESLGGSFITQENGPALGIYQMEPNTYDDVWVKVVIPDSKLKDSILLACDYVSKPPAIHLAYNMFFATIMARVDYSRYNEPLPNTNNINAIYAYYKKYYNSSKGAAEQDAFIEHYHAFVFQK